MDFMLGEAVNRRQAPGSMSGRNFQINNDQTNKFLENCLESFSELLQDFDVKQQKWRTLGKLRKKSSSYEANFQLFDVAFGSRSAWRVCRKCYSVGPRVFDFIVCRG